MAKVRDNLITEGLSGKLGKRLVFRKGRGGKTILATVPPADENREYNPAQLAQQEAFKKAAVYAKVAKNQAVYINLAKDSDATSFNLAVADWFGVPQVLDIDINNWTGQAGETIRVQAMDDTKVTSVHVFLRDGGTILEEGDAVPSDTDGLLWTYTTQTVAPNTSPLFLAVTAHDLPGNIGAQTQQLR